jgi:hypothetical protein
MGHALAGRRAKARKTHFPAIYCLPAIYCHFADPADSWKVGRTRVWHGPDHFFRHLKWIAVIHWYAHAKGAL